MKWSNGNGPMTNGPKRLRGAGGRAREGGGGDGNNVETHRRAGGMRGERRSHLGLLLLCFPLIHVCVGYQVHVATQMVPTWFKDRQLERHICDGKGYTKEKQLAERCADMQDKTCVFSTTNAVPLTSLHRFNTVRATPNDISLTSKPPALLFCCTQTQQEHAASSTKHPSSGQQPTSATPQRQSNSGGRETKM